MDVCLGCVSVHRLDESRGKIWYKYGKVGYMLHISLPYQSADPYTTHISLTLLITTLQLLISLKVFVGDSARRNKRQLDRNL